ncbi:MAG: hypothetical protein OCD76_22630 [Reichenbachiella sp.]
MKYCRFCVNRILDLQTGVQCGLDQSPIISNNKCPKFVLDQPEKNRIEQLRTSAEEYDETEEVKSYINFGWTFIPIIISIVAYFQLTKLNENYRWTIGTTYEHSTGFSINDPLQFKKFLHYTFQVNGISYQGKTKVDSESAELKSGSFNYFVRFNPDDPVNSEIEDFKMVPYFLKTHDIPANGIHRDSLKIFANQELAKYKRSNN